MDTARRLTIWIESEKSGKTNRRTIEKPYMSVLIIKDMRTNEHTSTVAMIYKKQRRTNGQIILEL